MCNGSYLIGLCATSGFSLVGLSRGAGSPGCPCYEAGSAPAKEYFATSDGQECAVFTAEDGTDLCYPREYGVGACTMWDKTLPPYCADQDGKRLLDAPEWCDDLWCYVDPNNCVGVEAPVQSAYFPGSPAAFYSYETCGVENAFDQHWEAMGKNATELIGIIDGYSSSLRADVEGTYAMASDAEAATTCSHWHSSCPCTTCERNEEWTSQILPGSSLTEMHVDFSKATLTLNALYNDGGPDVGKVECMTQVIASKFKSIVRREYNDKNRIAYMYYGDQATGGLVEWPALQWCTNTYDARLRPWYAAAASGPKDLIILLDGSMSMFDWNLWEPAANAAKAVLQTLTENDYATIVLYSSHAVAFHFDTLGAPDMLHPVTDANRDLMMRWLGVTSIKQGTNFRTGFELASKVFNNSLAHGRSSGCVRAILFLTDGKDRKGFVASELKTMGLSDVRISTYSFGNEADLVLPKKIACQHAGIWYHVKQGEHIKDVMAKYYQLFAAGIEEERVRWIEYTDAISGTQLLAGCLPSYDRRADNRLIGVSCIDINVIVSLETLAKKPGYAEMRASMRAASKTCPRILYGLVTLQELRRRVNSRALCSQCDYTDDRYCPITSNNSSVSLSTAPVPHLLVLAAIAALICNPISAGAVRA